MQFAVHITAVSLGNADYDWVNITRPSRELMGAREQWGNLPAASGMHATAAPHRHPLTTTRATNTLPPCIGTMSGTDGDGIHWTWNERMPLWLRVR